MNDKSGITTCFGDLFMEWKNNASSARAKLFGIKTFFRRVGSRSDNDMLMHAICGARSIIAVRS